MNENEFFEDIPYKKVLEDEEQEQINSDEEDEILEDGEEEEDDEEFDESEKSLYNEDFVKNTNLNERDKSAFEHSINCGFNIDNTELKKTQIIKFNEITKYIEQYKSMVNLDVDEDKYVNFKQSDCFICKWRVVIEKKQKNSTGEVETVVCSYPNVDITVYSCFIKLVEESTDITKSMDAYNYYLSKIQTPLNNNIRTYKKGNNNTKKIEFPDLNAIEIFLHNKEHNTSLKRKLLNQIDFYYNLSNFIVEEMGITKKNLETGEIYVDMQNFNVVNKCNEQFIKFYNASLDKTNKETKTTKKQKIN